MSRIYYEQEKNKMVNVDKFKGTISDDILENFNILENSFEINSNLRACHFFSQVMHESADFKVLTENLNYSAEALKRVFSKYFPDDLALQYARNPMKIASRVYANRMGNGDENSRDGWTYRGRGYIQLTGKHNYTKFGNSINESIADNPDLLTTPKYALLSAGWFWKSSGCNALADTGNSYETVKLVTKRINGGYHGLDDRFRRFNKLYSLFS